MLKVTDLRRAQAAWIENGGSHLAVVLEVGDGWVKVIFGTSKVKDIVPNVCVQHKQQAGIALGLNTTTYFYVSNVAYLLPTATVYSTRPAKCPPNIFHQLEDVAAEHARRDPLARRRSLPLERLAPAEGVQAATSERIELK